MPSPSSTWRAGRPGGRPITSTPPQPSACGTATPWSATRTRARSSSWTRTASRPSGSTRAPTTRTARSGRSSGSGPRLFQLLVRERPERLPVLERHRVLAGADEVAEPAVHQVAEGRDGPGFQAARAEEPKHRVGGLEDLELAF